MLVGWQGDEFGFAGHIFARRPRPRPRPRVARQSRLDHVRANQSIAGLSSAACRLIAEWTLWHLRLPGAPRTVFCNNYRSAVEDGLRGGRITTIEAGEPATRIW